MNSHFFTALFYFAFIWFRVQGSGFMVHGSGFKVHGSGFRVQGSRFKVQGSRFKRFKVQKVQRVQRGWCGAFRHPERRKRSCVKKWLI